MGIEPTFNKLGVIVKERAGKRKARIIWDLRESGVNKLYSQGERILLPRLSDVVGDALDVFRRGGTPSFFAIDVRDAFHNIPAGKDRAYTSAVVNIDGRQQILTFDVLVFGSVSSPTLWGRFAAWFGRTLAVVNPEVAMQVYVDDPIMVFDSQNPALKTLLKSPCYGLQSLGSPSNCRRLMLETKSNGLVPSSKPATTPKPQK